MMKKTIISILALLLVFSLAACGTAKEEEKGAVTTDAPSVTTADSGTQGYEDSGILYSSLSAAEKEQFVASAKENGATVTFGADGSTTIEGDDGITLIQKADGTWIYKGEDGGEAQIGGTWPDNEFTQQIPKPGFSIYMTGTEDDSFTAVFSGATIEGLRAYVELAKTAGFDIEATTTDESVMGIAIYTYTANNYLGYQLTVYSASGTCGLSVERLADLG